VSRLRISWWFPLLIPAALLLALHFVEAVERTASPPSDKWSRSATIGETPYNIQPAGAVLGSGRHVWAWSDEKGLAYTICSDQAEVLERGYCDGPGPACDINVVSVSGGGAVILWRDSSGHEAMSLKVGADGDSGPACKLVCEPVECLGLVRPEMVAVAMDGEIRLLSIDGEILGRFDVNGTVLDLDGVMKGREFIIALHTADQSADFISLVRFLPASGEPPQRMLLQPATYLQRTTRIQPVRLALVGTQAYIAWGSVAMQAGAWTGGAVKYCLVDLPSWDKGPTHSLLLRPDPFGGVSDSMGDATFAPSQDGKAHLLLAAVARESIRRSQQDVFHVTVEEDEIVGVERVSRSRQTAVRPAVLTSPQGYTVAWLEAAGFGRYVVRIAGTTQELREALNPVSARDYGEALGELVSSLLTSVTLLPIVIIWVLVSFMVLLVPSVISITWAERHAYYLIGGAVALHLAIRTPDIVHRFYRPWLVPLLPAWLLPPWGVFLAPALISVASLYSGILAFLKDDQPIGRAYRGYAVFALVDSLLLAFIYGPYVLR